jgi:hypothetical protein
MCDITTTMRNAVGRAESWTISILADRSECERCYVSGSEVKMGAYDLGGGSRSRRIQSRDLFKSDFVKKNAKDSKGRSFRAKPEGDLGRCRIKRKESWQAPDLFSI